MLIKVKKTIEETREISLPMYVDHGCSLYKIISENEVIEVGTGIRFHPDYAYQFDNLTGIHSKVITQEAFDLEYYKALDFLKTLNHEPVLQEVSDESHD